MTHGLRRAACAALALGALSACGRPLDLDMRNLGGGFSTTDAAMNAADGSVPGVAGAAPLAPPPPGGDFVTTASAAIDRATPVTTTSLAPVASAPLAPAAAPLAPAPAAPAPSGTSHRVMRGETAYSIARLYGVSVGAIAGANGLGPDLAIREGQTLVVPPGGTPSATQVVTQPGQGSPTPVPPSASAPLPDEEPIAPAAEAPDPAPVPQNLGAQQTQASDAQLVMPVSGSIIRAYAPGRNEGIDIGAPAGAEVRAADAGTVAAVTTNTEGVQIVVIKHAGDLLTVYTHLENLTVQKDSVVSRGQVIGEVRPGDPSYLHFEVRRGMQSQDPSEFLP